MIVIRDERFSDIASRERLLDACFGDARFAKTCERLREGRLPALSLVAERESRVVGTVRLWHVTLGPGRAGLMLGPLAVDPSLQGEGLGGRLMREAIGRARALGHGAIVLVGDAPYYARFGFCAGLTEGLWLPGPYERDRFQALELAPGAMDDARGLVQATGMPEPEPDWATLVAAAAGEARHAA